MTGVHTNRLRRNGEENSPAPGTPEGVGVVGTASSRFI
jgi:hypothetical protein